ncbi:MAG: lineage-specific thermal regulator protein [Planctomycetes bacterium ADurb.Bin412]|nr:MAG: lineage-specific thermal regulator protein [Planctomycetes bacterium ADurb.Bin412]
MSNSRETLIPDWNGCPCSGANLEKLLQPAILTVLAREDLHGYRLVQQLGSMALFHGQSPDASGVYRSLKSLEQRGIVKSRWDVSAQGPTKRLYHLTAAGLKCLDRWTATLRNYQQAMNQLLAEAQKLLPHSPVS